MKRLNYLLTVLLLSISFSSSWATKVLVAGAGLETHLNAVADNVTASGLFESVDIFMTRDATPTLAQIQDYDVILYWTYYGPQSQINLGNVFVEYINQGGGLITFALESTSNSPLQGNFTDDYRVIVGGQAFKGSPLTSFTVDIANHPTMEGVTSIYGNTNQANRCYAAGTTTLTPGSYKVATDNDGKALLALREGVGEASARRAFINFLPVPSNILTDWTIDANCDATRLITNTIQWVAGGSIDGDKKNIIGQPDTIIYTAQEDETFQKWYKKQNEGAWVEYNNTDTFLIETYDTVSEWHYMVEMLNDTVLDSTAIFTVQSKYAQTLTFDPLVEMAMTDADQAPVTSTNSDSTVTFTSSNEAIATIVNGKVHPVSTGTVTISAITEENDWYWASETLTQDVTIKSQGQTITFALVDTAYVGDADVTPGATATSSLAVSYSSSDSSIATIVDNKVRFVSEGTCTIYADQAGNGTYAAAPQVSQELTVMVYKPMIVDITPTDGSNLLKDSTYTASATITTGDASGIDSAIIVFGTSIENLIDTMSLTADADTFSTSFSINSVGTYYSKIVAYGVNGEITSSNYYIWTTECPTIKTVKALAANEITSESFKAHWTTSLDAASYKISVWKEVEGDSIYAYENTTANDTFFIATGLDENTSYYYNVKVVAEAGCESDVSNTITLNTATATSIDAQRAIINVTTKPGIINISTSAESDVRIYHISGQKVIAKTIYNSENFSVDNGIYLVKVNGEVTKVIVP